MKKLLVFYIIAISALVTEIRGGLPEPYNQITVLPELRFEWWYNNRVPMTRLITTRNVRLVVEVGSWLGASTCHMAELVPKDGKVYAIDTWLGSIEHQPGQSAYHPFLPVLYEQFLSNVIARGLCNKIVPIRATSLETASTWILPVDLIYIDGDHEVPAVYADIEAWYPFVEGHGIICGDDYCWGGVRQAVHRYADEHQLTVRSEKNFWWYEE